MKILIFSYSILLICVVVSAQYCNLTRFSVTYSDVFQSNIIQSFTGCLVPANFNYRKVRSIFIRNEIIPTIPVHFIENHEELHEIEIHSSGIQNILPGAFRNLPKLQHLTIKGNDFPSVLTGALNTIPNLDTMWLGSNGISYIEEQAFHIPQLRWICICGNALYRWNQEWFGKLDKLEEIQFADNHLSTIPRRAFSNFPKLKIIGLLNNQITNIEPEAFEPLNHIAMLDLRNNKIALLNANSFPTPSHIDYFYIDLNHLNFIPQALLSKLYSEYLYIDFNPLTCACSSVINQWALLNNVTLDRKNCTPKSIPLCTAFKPRCTEEINPKGTQKYLDIFKKLTSDQYSCVHEYMVV